MMGIGISVFPGRDASSFHGDDGFFSPKKRLMGLPHITAVMKLEYAAEVPHSGYLAG